MNFSLTTLRDELATDLEIQPIPMSALEGVNITSKSNETDWYDGPSLMDYLETVPVGDRRLNACPPSAILICM